MQNQKQQPPWKHTSQHQDLLLRLLLLQLELDRKNIVIGLLQDNLSHRNHCQNIQEQGGIGEQVSSLNTDRERVFLPLINSDRNTDTNHPEVGEFNFSQEFSSQRQGEEKLYTFTQMQELNTLHNKDKYELISQNEHLKERLEQLQQRILQLQYQFECEKQKSNHFKQKEECFSDQKIKMQYLLGTPMCFNTTSCQKNKTEQQNQFKMQFMTHTECQQKEERQCSLIAELKREKDELQREFDLLKVECQTQKKWVQLEKEQNKEFQQKQQRLLQKLSRSQSQTNQLGLLLEQQLNRVNSLMQNLNDYEQLLNKQKNKNIKFNDYMNQVKNRCSNLQIESQNIRNQIDSLKEESKQKQMMTLKKLLKKFTVTAEQLNRRNQFCCHLIDSRSTIN